MDLRPKFRSPIQPNKKPLSSSSSSSPLPSFTFPKMPLKSLLKPRITLLLASFLFIFSLYYTLFSTGPQKDPINHSISPRNYLNFLENLNDNGNGNDNGLHKVKVYMYELPRRFTYGLVESYAAIRGGPKPGEGAKYPGHQHMGEWYLFKDLIRSSEDRVDSPVTRVMDPDQADLFYVPFFSSLSLVVNPIWPPNPDGERDESEYNDEETQEALFEWLEKQVYWKRNNGWDHVFICQDPNALYKVVGRVKNGVLLVSDFGRIGNQGSLVKDVILPYVHRVNPYKGEIGVENRNTLLFFMGQRYRKEGGKIRDLLFQLLENETNVSIKEGKQSRVGRREATQGMHTSKFCLHPAGDTPSSCRLFDAIVSLCIPVIVSDYIELPFEEVIDYRKIAVFVATKEAVKPGYLINLLRKVGTDQILDFQKELKKVKRYFVYEDPNGTVNEIWRQVSLKLPLIKLMRNRDKRLVTRDLPEPDCSCLCSNRSGINTTLNTAGI